MGLGRGVGSRDKGMNIGNFVNLISVKCGIPNVKNVYGVDINKQFIKTKANINEIDTSRYIIVPPNSYAANLMHIGRDKIIPVALNNTINDLIVSPAYFIFEVDTRFILPVYFYMVMSSNEFDRYAWFCTDSSVRGNLDWDRFCDIEINLPPVPIQQKYVDVYNALSQNQKAYEKGLDDLKLTCDAYIERLRRELPHIAIGNYISPRMEKNYDLKITVAQGVNTEKFFVSPRQVAEDKKNAQIVRKYQFAYNMATTRNGEKISIAYRDGCDCVVSSAYQVFEIDKKDELLPEYLMMWFKRSEFDRYVRYHSWGSAHEFFTFEDMCEVKFPIPNISVQQSIVNIYNSYITRRKINERMKQQIKDICPVLVKGAVGEGK